MAGLTANHRLKRTCQLPRGRDRPVELLTKESRRVVAVILRAEAAMTDCAATRRRQPVQVRRPARHLNSARPDCVAARRHAGGYEHRPVVPATRDSLATKSLARTAAHPASCLYSAATPASRPANLSLPQSPSATQGSRTTDCDQMDGTWRQILRDASSETSSQQLCLSVVHLATLERGLKRKQGQSQRSQNVESVRRGSAGKQNCSYAKIGNLDEIRNVTD